MVVGARAVISSDDGLVGVVVTAGDAPTGVVFVGVLVVVLEPPLKLLHGVVVVVVVP